MFLHSSSNEANYSPLKNVMGHILASITISGAWVASGATMVELRSIIPCDSHLPPHCTDSLSDQWARHCWIAYRGGGAVRMGCQKYREIWALREKLLDICFVLSFQWPQDNGAAKAKLKQNWIQSEISQCEEICQLWKNFPFKWGNVSSVLLTVLQ